MTALISTISSQFTKAIILGFFSPAVIFVVLWLIFIEPLFPEGATPLRLFEQVDTGWQVLAATFIAIFLTILLYVLNTPLVRFYEGYPWQHSFFGRWKAGRARAAYRREKNRFLGLRTLIRYLKENKELKDNLRVIRDAYWRSTVQQYPDDEGKVMPTRLGNVIRSFEYYPTKQYKLDAVALWPHLAAVLPADYSSAIQDARTAFNFMLSSTFVMAVLSGLTLLLGLIFPLTAAPSGAVLPWLMQVSGFAVVSYLFYLGSISSAYAWGSYVKAAFDLYRWELLEKLGYKTAPASRDEEFKIWEDISINTIYGYDKQYPPIPYKKPETSLPHAETSVEAIVKARALKLTRALQAPISAGGTRVVLVLTNTHAQETARDVVISDAVPSGYALLWGSAEVSVQGGAPRTGPRLRTAGRFVRSSRLGRWKFWPGVPLGWRDRRSVSVQGSNPYRFSLPDLPPGARLVLTYRIVLFPEKEKPD